LLQDELAGRLEPGQAHEECHGTRTPQSRRFRVQEQRATEGAIGQFGTQPEQREHLTAGVTGRFERDASHMAGGRQDLLPPPQGTVPRGLHHEGQVAEILRA
jgi:hypothetical protein